MTPDELAIQGFKATYEWGGLVLLEFVIIVGLAMYCVWITKKVFTLVEKLLAALVDNTRTIAEFKEVLKDVSRNRS